MLGGVWITLKSQRLCIALMEREGDKGAFPQLPPTPTVFHLFCFLLPVFPMW